MDRIVTRILVAALAMAVTCGLLTACGSSADSHSTSDTSGSFPITVDNCGMKQTFDGPPERVVTIKSTSTELLLALGLGDKIVGRAFDDGPIPDRWAGDADSIPKLSDKAPSQEVVLDKEPDLIYAGWESNLSADNAGERDSLEKLGVNTYVSPAACKEPKYQPDKMTFELLFEQFMEIGKIFDVPDKAETLIGKQKHQLADVRKAESGTTALWYSSATSTPYVGGGIGAPQMMLDTLGLENIAADVNDTWTSVSWEKIAEANPDVIVLVDAEWNSAEQKKTYLKKNPVTSEMDAVRHERYLTIPFPASEAGVRSANATARMGEQLTDLGLAN